MENEKEILLDLMKLELRDERRYLRRIRRKKEERQRRINSDVGIRKLESILRKIIEEVNKRMEELKKKYRTRREQKINESLFTIVSKWRLA